MSEVRDTLYVVQYSPDESDYWIQSSAGPDEVEMRMHLEHLRGLRYGRPYRFRLIRRDLTETVLEESHTQTAPVGAEDMNG